MEARHLLKALKDHGWYLGDTEETIRQYVHKEHDAVITVGVRYNDDLSEAAAAAILAHAGIDPKEVKV